MFLASPAAAGITGQAIGIGGDKLTLYSHPAEAMTSFRDGGWTAEEIAAEWTAAFDEHRQRSGIELPPLQLEAHAAS